MNKIEKHNETIKQLLLVEHNAVANKLGFINTSTIELNEKLLHNSIAIIDEMSRSKEDDDKRIVVIASAILWSYRNPQWDGLRDFLTLALSRAGFSPSSMMIDDSFDYENGVFSSIDSIFDRFAITIHQLNSEIFVGDKKFLVTNFQKRIWEKLSSVKLLGISAPTSAGKSFIILLKAIDIILRNQGSIVYIVPTLSLVSQVAADFNSQLKNFGLANYLISTTYNLEDVTDNKIYVLTQEKAISAFSQAETPFRNIQILVVDEIQNIERVSSEHDQRSKILYDTLIELRHSSQIGSIVLSGPRVEGLKELGIDIFDEQHTEVEKVKSSPVANITYAISKERNKYYFNQYCDSLKNPNKIEIKNPHLIKGHGKVQYNADYYKYIAAFTECLGEDSRNIIFAPTTSKARDIAVEISKLKKDIILNVQADSLISYIKETVHQNYDMCNTIPKGVAYHHSKIPSHVRIVMERAIKDKLITNTVCTTTLMQGVNLPAQNIIMRNPDLSIRNRGGEKPKLTDYEIANLRGRAGRLLKDFIGRTFVLDENAFEKKDEQMTLFPEAEKTLHSGYRDKYLQHKNEINIDLLSNTVENTSNIEYSFLITYIRQTILRHNKNSIERLRAVGIIINDNELQEIADRLLKGLVVPREICYKNRYWDPLILNEIYKKRDDFIVPTSHMEDRVELKIENLLNKYMIDFPSYYDKYLYDLKGSRIRSASIAAKDWMKEKTLKQILSTPYYDTPEKIDATIGLIQKEISFGLPMLLKPIYDIKDPNSMFLRFIELGAYKPITRKMIEMNIPRETAIFLTNNFFTESNDINNTEIISRLRQIKSHINYWQQIQIENIL